MSNPALIVDMPNASVATDGSFVEMELKNEDGFIQYLRFSPDKMMLFLSKVFQLYVNQKIQKESSQGYVVEQPIPAVTTMAQEDIDGKAVILLLKMQNGLPASFVVQPSEAEELHRQLGKAIKKIGRKWH